jgi:hypothetical protein
MAKRTSLHPKAEYICADLSSRPSFPLAVVQRTIRQYCAVDSITASSTPRSCSHVNKRRNSPGMVANRRRSGFNSGAHPRPLPSGPSCVRQFLQSCRPSKPPGGKGQEACAKTSNTVTCYQPSQRNGWRDTDWFKHASQTKLGNGLNSSRVAPVFAVPRQFDRKASGSTRFSSLWVGRRPMRNSEVGPAMSCTRT